ncbi:malonyl-ACP O-methyltransferase BioC [Sansalvadorimonas sp. 2012CJ34-2]|uniref:Malonyl-[acyl-carrier protein] O-methyltransferase n=1 Tax=Parendozoicomonas callyspongiae TaxID=2942213 RepID=A0ABT0PII4_9GAMM|nr:malonyl-ACP O-methyltransferase BioC [Sansalvadorimonas sp. 2012CJ34-2]MCL6271205.1 malonyl-ACP O-methyltransferase BioC [Sansalvadorimonas sp. 2012CJ34-2]
MTYMPTLTGEVITPRVDKRQVAESFSKAAGTYDSAATLQQIVAARVRLGLPDLDEGASILDMGCGTGFETRALVQRFPTADVAGLDISEGMLAYAQNQPDLKNCQWLSGDIEELPFHENRFDLVFSSLAVQWCDCFSEVLEQVKRVLKPGGRFVFSTLAAGSLHELQQAWLSVDSSPHVNQYESHTLQKQRVNASGLKVDTFCQQTETLYYPSVLHLLREMKALGANTVINSQGKGLSGRSVLKTLTKGYESYKTEKGFPASYQVVYGVLCKPDQISQSE